MRAMLRAMSCSLQSVVALLGRLAPLDLAEDWDNVGLLLEPSERAIRDVSRLFLCIDLSESVLAEALELGADFVLAYHPPIFRGLKRLRASSAEERVLVRALEAGVALYSPHTALDATPNGVNDWLARGVGAGRHTPLKPHASQIETGAARAGAGRLLELDSAISLSDAVTRLKAHLGLDSLRVAQAEGHAQGAKICRVAVCAGAGGSLFEAVGGVDLFVTGEMRHHDVLAKLAAGSSVILAGHTHTERGFLPEFARRIAEHSNGELRVLVSQRDADPLCTV
jgi:dinuclear metal center YbgI/SA1388 family protein